MAFIFYLSSLPSSKPPLGDLVSLPNALYHVAEFGLLGFLMCSMFAKCSTQFSSSFLLASSYGVLDEVHQFFVPTRYCTLVDVCADAIGSFLGVMFFLLLQRRLGRSELK